MVVCDHLLRAGLRSGSCFWSWDFVGFYLGGARSGRSVCLLFHTEPFGYTFHRMVARRGARNTYCLLVSSEPPEKHIAKS